MVYAQWQGLLDRLHEGGHNMEVPRGALRGLSTLGLDKRVKAINELMLTIRPASADDMASMLLNARGPELRNITHQLLNVTGAALVSLAQNWHPTTHLVDGNDSYLLIMERAGAPTGQVDLSDFFRQIGDFSASLLTVVSQIVPLCKATGVADFVMSSNALAQKLNEVESLKVKAGAVLNQSEDVHQRTLQLEAEAKQFNAQTSELVTRIRELSNLASADSGQVTAWAEQVRMVASNAETLNQVVTGYHPKFEAFQKSLDTSNDEFLAFSANTETAKEANAEHEAKIVKLTTLANDMLAGSTTAGLSKALEVARTRYETRMEGARNGFYIAVTILLISALPLAAHLIPNLFGTLIPALDQKADGSPFSVIGKVLLLLPATWLTAFFTQTYANLFQLEREYAHKAALAGSVHGFKLQAPKYEEEITAEVFMEIRMNPAHAPSVKAASHPLYDVLAKVVGKVLAKTKDNGEA